MCSSLVGGLPFVAHVALLACVGGLAFAVCAFDGFLLWVRIASACPTIASLCNKVNSKHSPQQTASITSTYTVIKPWQRVSRAAEPDPPQRPLNGPPCHLSQGRIPEHSTAIENMQSVLKPNHRSLLLLHVGPTLLFLSLSLSLLQNSRAHVPTFAAPKYTARKTPILSGAPL